MNIHSLLLEILDAIESRLFVQDTEPTMNENLVGRVPCDSSLAMTDGQFRIAGEMMATSIVQGGPAPDFLSDWVYNYFSSGIEGVIVDETKSENQRIRNLIERVSLKYRYLLNLCIWNTKNCDVYQQQNNFRNLCKLTIIMLQHFIFSYVNYSVIAVYRFVSRNEYI